MNEWIFVWFNVHNLELGLVGFLKDSNVFKHGNVTPTFPPSSPNDREEWPGDPEEYIRSYTMPFIY